MRQSATQSVLLLQLGPELQGTVARLIPLGRRTTLLRLPPHRPDSSRFASCATSRRTHVRSNSMLSRCCTQCFPVFEAGRQTDSANHSALQPPVLRRCRAITQDGSHGNFVLHLCRSWSRAQNFDDTRSASTSSSGNRGCPPFVT